MEKGIKNEDFDDVKPHLITKLCLREVNLGLEVRFNKSFTNG